MEHQTYGWDLEHSLEMLPQAQQTDSPCFQGAWFYQPSLKIKVIFKSNITPATPKNTVLWPVPENGHQI